MKVLYIASESCPFAKTGGLGEIIGTLPRVLRSQDIDVRVVLPKYGSIASEHKEKMVLKKHFFVPVGWRNQYCGLEELESNGVPYYFIDNEYYFNRDNIYGYDDEAERFAFYSRAALEAIPFMDFEPDIIHCHDWHTAMVSVFLEAHYRKNKLYKDIKTVFSIHNLRYQGIFPKEIMGDLLHLTDEYFHMDKLEFFDRVNYLKGGIVFADKLTTVSQTYAEEIQTPSFGENLDGLLRHKNDKLVGILNGICHEKYNPTTDPDIFVNFRRSLVKKQKNKEMLQALLNLPVRNEVPMIALVSRLVEQKGLDLIDRVLEEMLALDVQLVVMGSGDEKYEEMLRKAAIKYPDKVSANIFYEDHLERKIIAGSDMFLMPSLFEPCGITQMIAMRYGCVPIVRETGGLKDTVTPFNEFTGEGNGFSFTNYNAHDMLYTIERAMKFYHDNDIWNGIFKNVIKMNFSWRKSAKKYKALYEQLLKD